VGHPQFPTGLPRAFLHIIEEFTRHAGHADIIRESIDGSTMYELLFLSTADRGRATDGSVDGREQLAPVEHAPLPVSGVQVALGERVRTLEHWMICRPVLE
jgi:hypothetical protein